MAYPAFWLMKIWAPYTRHITRAAAVLSSKYLHVTWKNAKKSEPMILSQQTKTRKIKYNLMKKYLILSVILVSLVSFAFAQKAANTRKSQFLFIIRYNTNFKPASKEAVQSNIKKWQDYMDSLAKSGNLAGGYRPDNDGVTISGTGKSVKSTPYMS